MFVPRRTADAGRVFFFNDTATTEIYTLSLHDALPISSPVPTAALVPLTIWRDGATSRATTPWLRSLRFASGSRSEEYTSELQSRQYLVCRLLLEKKTKLPPTTPRLRSRAP